ncbi:DJ-1/PfpI family protein [Enterovibrio sp. ZSDZ35]|uniref:DJ-1/PfpI family protein n=1 Tax=Enterovibrio qingdaonensis TaxID=2899818 RepID=A0ABT5QPH9_9GAMM|nr:DJ-1/PfpI family protein [Enterovibrio sp. ZSDZ35]MDD1782889.1 DJ-1/PfpI family protein [Enterovibrio sp. ZSDZ35]
MTYSAPKKIAFICFEGFQSLDLTGPLEVFDLAVIDGKAQYENVIFSPEGGLVASSSGIVVATQPFASLKGFHAMVIVGGVGSDLAMTQRNIVDYISEQSKEVERIISICSGALILAKTTLLDGLKATTHWSLWHRLQSTNPRLDVVKDAIFVKQGNIYTSAGVTAGMDLALAIVQEDCGREISLDIAKGLVIYFKRPGGQKQFSDILQSQSINNDKINQACTYINNNIKQDLSVQRLAKLVNMSARNFSRVFTKELKISPAKYVERVRVHRACLMLENRNLNTAQVADTVGINSADVLSRLFQKYFSVSASQYREHFC